MIYSTLSITLIDNNILHFFYSCFIHITEKTRLVYPTLVKPAIGSTVIFYCYLAGNVTWYFENGPLPENAAVKKVPGDNVVLVIIDQVDPVNQGSYQCQGKHPDSDVLYQAEGTLVIDLEGTTCSICFLQYNCTILKVHNPC